MTTTTATHRAISLAGVTWTENGRRGSFRSARPGYGVEVIATGEVLSKNGVYPSSWNLKSAAAMVAESAEALDWATVQIWHPQAGV
jgi:hypothetical protein